MDLIDANIIQSQLSIEAQQLFSPIIVFPTIDSTNNYLLNLTPLEKKSGYVCIAEQQTAGRGRLGRSWIATPMQNICMSVLWEIPAQQNIIGVSLVAGMAILRALQKLSMQDIKIKWPNDVTIQDKKIAGILIETTDPRFLVIGMGINVLMPPETEVGQPWTSVEQCLAKSIARNEIIAVILNSLAAELQEFQRHGLESLVADWAEVDALSGKVISIQRGDQILHGIAKGINQEGALLLSQGNILMPVYSGEIKKEKS